jgi:glycosyltransferase involved in cell wall biosynthesis
MGQPGDYDRPMPEPSEIPRVSVLIGCWNNADTLSQAMDSILSQSVQELELIVVDDGSTDGTHDLVRSVPDPRVRYLPLEHVGISLSLNRGLEMAAAPVVAVQDADDWSLPTRLERELAVLDAWPQVAVVGCRMREVGPAGEELRPRTAFRAGNVNRALMRFNPIPNSCAAFRREAALAVGGYDRRYRYAMDHDLWLRMAEHHEVFAFDEVLAVRRMGGSNVAARRERAQLRETLEIRGAALRRRRSLAGASGLVLPAISYLTPLPLKRALRKRLGQAP